MSAEKGSAFLLKVGDGGDAAGLRHRGGACGRPSFRSTARRSTSPARIRAAGANCCPAPGVRSVSVAGSGIFTGSAAETRIKANALAGLIDDYELSFESGERMRGRFLLTRLDYAGDHNGERTYALAPGKLRRGGGGMTRAANPARGEAALTVGGEAILLRPSFAALVAAEEELGPLFALVERAAEGRLDAWRNGRLVLPLRGGRPDG